MPQPGYGKTFKEKQQWSYLIASLIPVCTMATRAVSSGSREDAGLARFWQVHHDNHDKAKFSSETCVPARWFSFARSQAIML